MILFTPKDDSKEGFNKLLVERAGGADNLTHKAIYDAAYGLYCSLAHVTDKKRSFVRYGGGSKRRAKRIAATTQRAKRGKQGTKRN